jgi:hypothetical protein
MSDKADHDGIADDVYASLADRALEAVTDGAFRRSSGVLFSRAQAAIDRGEVDLIVLAARRLLCLYQLLVEAGMPELTRCEVVSDRFLDQSGDQWRDRNVLVLDDSVVVGTTLHRLHGQLAARVGPNGTVRFRAICVDREQRVDYLLAPLDFEALSDGSTQDVQKFAVDLVVALFRAQIPFFSDFLPTAPLNLDSGNLTDLLSSFGWLAADVTAAPFDERGHHAFVQIPRDDELSRLLSRVPPTTALLVDAVKLRSYVKELDDNRLSVVLLPIAMLRPCSPQELQVALQDIEAATGPDFVIQTLGAASEPVAQHRIVQLFVAMHVLATFWNENQDRIKLPELRRSIHPLSSSLYFGVRAEAALDALVAGATNESAETGPVSPTAPSLNTPVPSALLAKRDIQDMLWEARELLNVVGVPEAPSPGELTKIGLVFAHAVASVFGYVHENYELPQREHIAGLGSLDAYEVQYANTDKRWLSHGFTLSELREALTPERSEDTAWSRALVSLGIDSSNDLGISVPVTRFDEMRGLVYRYYRLGETAPLAGEPLWRSVRSGVVDDVLAQLALDKRVPLLSSRMRGGWPVDDRPDDEVDLRELAVLLASAVPGRVTRRFEGRVLARTEEDFDAELRDTSGDDVRLATLRLDQVQDADREFVHPGAHFTWSVFTEDRFGARRSTSNIRVVPSVPYQSSLDDGQVESLRVLFAGSGSDF